MTITEVFEEYKHLDKLLSDEYWLNDSIHHRILYVLWQAIKEAQPKQL